MQSRDYVTVRCPSIYLSHSPADAAGLLPWARRAGDDDELLPAAALQHGAQQQMRAVPRCQPT